MIKCRVEVVNKSAQYDNPDRFFLMEILVCGHSIPISDQVVIYHRWQNLIATVISVLMICCYDLII